MDQVVKTEVYLTEPSLLPWMENVWRERFPKDPPARTVVEVGDEHIIPGALIEVFAIAIVPDANTKKRGHLAAGLPGTLGALLPGREGGAPSSFTRASPRPISQTGIPVGKDPDFPHYRSNPEDQTNYVLGNMEKCAQAAGTTLQNAIKSQLYHIDRNDFHDIDMVWKSYMNVPPPRSAMEIKGLMVPGALMTANLISLIPDAKHQKKEILYTDQFHPSMRTVHFSPAIEAGDWIFLAGQVATDFKTPVLGVHPKMPHYGIDIEIQAEFVMKNLKELLEHCGATLDDVVVSHIFPLDARADYRGFERTYKKIHSP